MSPEEPGVEPCAICSAPIHVALGKWMTKWRDGRKIRICRRCDRTGAWHGAGLQDDAPLSGPAVARGKPDNGWRRYPDSVPAEEKEDGTMPKRTFVCLDCKSECECAPVGIVPKRCESCKKAAKLKGQELHRAAKGAKLRGRKAGRPRTSPAADALGDLLDARIREICEQHVVIGKDVVEGVVEVILGERLSDLVDARIRAVFAGRAKA